MQTCNEWRRHDEYDQMKFGLFGINFGACADPDGAKRVAQAAEEGGFESLWTGEHVVLPDPQVPPSPVSAGDALSRSGGGSGSRGRAHEDDPSRDRHHHLAAAQSGDPREGARERRRPLRWAALVRARHRLSQSRVRRARDSVRGKRAARDRVPRGDPGALDAGQARVSRVASSRFRGSSRSRGRCRSRIRRSSSAAIQSRRFGARSSTATAGTASRSISREPPSASKACGRRSRSTRARPRSGRSRSASRRAARSISIA